MIKYVVVCNVNNRIIGSVYSAVDIVGCLEAFKRIVSANVQIVGVVEYNATSPALRSQWKMK